MLSWECTVVSIVLISRLIQDCLDGNDGFHALPQGLHFNKQFIDVFNILLMSRRGGINQVIELSVTEIEERLFEFV